LVFVSGLLKEINVAASDCHFLRGTDDRHGISIYIANIDIWNSNKSIFKNDKTSFDLAFI
jgi:hypothetical protein